MVEPLQITERLSLKKLKIELSYDSAIPPLGTYQKELKAKSQRDICTALFIVAKTWEQLKCVC